PVLPSFPTRRSSDLYFAESTNCSTDLSSYYLSTILALLSSYSSHTTSLHLITCKPTILSSKASAIHPRLSLFYLSSNVYRLSIRSEEHTSELQSRFD